VKSAVDWFLKSQLPDCSFFDLLDAGKRRSPIGVEADVEYLLVQAAYKSGR